MTLTTRVAPAGATTVSFRLYRYDAAKRAYRYVGSFGRTTDANSRASLAWTPSAGRYHWPVAVPPTVEFVNTLSAAYRWSSRADRTLPTG